MTGPADAEACCQSQDEDGFCVSCRPVAAEPRAVGMREMSLTRDEARALQRHVENPSDFPSRQPRPVPRADEAELPTQQQVREAMADAYASDNPGSPRQRAVHVPLDNGA